MATGGELSEAASSGVGLFVSEWRSWCIVGLSDNMALCRIGTVSVPLSGNSLLGFFTTSFSLRLSDLSASVEVAVVSSVLFWSVWLLDNMSPKILVLVNSLIILLVYHLRLGFEVLNERLAC